jgi:peroxiredoxin
MPYSWVNDVLIALAVGALIGVLGYSVSALFTRKGHRKLPLMRAGYFVLGFILVGAANYALVWMVQMPAMADEATKAIQTRADAASFVKVGDLAPGFRVKTMDGSEFDLTSARGKTVLLNFFATWCGPCLQELPHVQKLWDEYRDRTDFVLLVVGREETDESLHAFMAKNKYSFPAAADPNRSAYRLYAKELIPRTYLIAPDGKIAFASIGFNKDDLERLKAELDRRLANHR